GGRVREHPTFLTATVELPGRRRLDIATARRERYLRPGALPEVAAGAVRGGLWRRGFSLNALALRLPPAAWGELLDPTGGGEDLRRKEIRILHPLSFVEDPTRILRAGRFATRLDFRLEPATGRLLAEAAKLGSHPALSGDRVRAELGRVLAEPDPEGVLQALGGLGRRRPPRPGPPLRPGGSGSPRPGPTAPRGARACPAPPRAAGGPCPDGSRPGRPPPHVVAAPRAPRRPDGRARSGPGGRA